MTQKKVKKIGLYLGIIIFAAILLMPTPNGLDVIGQKVLATAALMIIWWSTDAIPLAITSLLPLVLLPLLGVTSNKGENGISFYASYSHWVVFLIMSVFFISAAIVKWDLHKRISLTIVKLFGGKPNLIILGFMVSTAIVSMWMSNTTATAMMIPVALALVEQLSSQSKELGVRLNKALVLSIPFSASIGGIGSIIGTGTNMSGIALIEEMTGHTISFTGWFKIGLPFVIVILPIVWIFLVKFFKVNEIEATMSTEMIDDELSKLGPLSAGERNVLIVFFGTALLWVTSELWKDLLPFVKDETIGMLGATMLFILPVENGEPTLDIKTAINGISWETVLLVGGSMAIGGVIATTGVADWLGGYLGFLENFNEVVIVLLIALICSLVTEVMTNMVVVTAFMPMIVGIGNQIGIDPMILMLTAIISSSFGFMLPQATPPNAIAVGAGGIEIKDMIKAGFWVKLICVAIFPIVMYGITKGIFKVV